MQRCRVSVMELRLGKVGCLLKGLGVSAHERGHLRIPGQVSARLSSCSRAYWQTQRGSHEATAPERSRDESAWASVNITVIFEKGGVSLKTYRYLYTLSLGKAEHWSDQRCNDSSIKQSNSIRKILAYRPLNGLRHSDVILSWRQKRQISAEALKFLNKRSDILMSDFLITEMWIKGKTLQAQSLGQFAPDVTFPGAN